MPHREPPPVTISGAPVQRGEAEPPSTRGLGAGAFVLVAAVLLLGAAVVGSRPTAAPVPPPIDVALRLVDDGLLNSQSGVLVLPVEVVNRGGAVRVASSVLWAEPVRQEPASSGRRRIAAQDTGRVVVLLQPDCALLNPGQDIVFAATLVVELSDDAGQQQQARLALGAEPAVAARVAALCGASG